MTENEKTTTPVSPAQANKERLKEITDRIEAGIKDVFQSDRYKQYLRTMSRFHHYSINNSMLIFLQKPEATRVAGFNAWHDKFGRSVNKGEKGITIIAPTPWKKKVEQEKLDPDTKLPMLDKDGNPVTEEKVIQIPMFRPVKVFDVSQTSGRPLPVLAATLTGDVQNYEDFMEAVKRSSPVPIEIKPLPAGTDGYYSVDKRSITLREGMSQVQTVCAAIHEMGHAKLHSETGKNLDNDEKFQTVAIFAIAGLFSNGRIDKAKVPEGMYCYDLRGSDDDPGSAVCVENSVAVNHAGSVITAKPLPIPENGRLMFTEEEGMNFIGRDMTIQEFWHKFKKSRQTEELEAESISYSVCAYYGIETGENSFGYLASWSKDKELPELKASLETITKTADSIITDIDRHFAEIRKERETEAIENQEAMYLLDDDKLIHIQLNSDCHWDYSIYDSKNLSLIDGGVLDLLDLSLKGARDVIIEDNGFKPKEITKLSTEAMEQKLDIINAGMPDPTVTVEAMHEYGYTDPEMLPLSRSMAQQLFSQDVTVYALLDGNTEAIVYNQEDLDLHSGMFGITRDDWSACQKMKPAVTASRTEEEAFLSAKGDAYAIYQLKDIPDNARLLFMNTEYLDKNSIPIDRANYDLVYTGELPKYGTTEEKLDQLYEQFNIHHPSDFKGHSLSVSDIVALKQGEHVSCHYCDNEGFARVSHFLPLRNAEMSVEDDYNMIDGIINNGKKDVSEQDEHPGYIDYAKDAKPKQSHERVSVLAKLHAYQQEPQPVKSNMERNVTNEKSYL